MKTALSVSALLLGALPLSAQDREVRIFTREFDARVRESTQKGLSFLVRTQNPNGSWTSRVGYSDSGVYTGEETESVDATALACMALMGAGHVPGRGRYGRRVEAGVDWLLSKCRLEDGYITHAGSRMYSHAFATLFLAEVYGMTRRPDVKQRVRRAIDLLVNSQNPAGGWRHQPIPVDADLSVTAIAIQALRSARNAGLAVTTEAVDQAMKYVSRCANRGGFAYMPVRSYEGYDRRVTYAMTAAGIASSYSLGQYDSEQVRAALKALASWRHNSAPGRLHYFYAHYFAAQATYMAGDDVWTMYYPRVKAEILRMQEGDGHWEDDVSPAYATSMACLVLQTPCEYLSFFQK